MCRASPRSGRQKRIRPGFGYSLGRTGPGLRRRPASTFILIEMADPDQIPTSEITPQSVYFNGQNLVRGAIAAASAATTGLLYRRLNGRSKATVEAPPLAGLTAAPASADAASAGFQVDEPMTPLGSVTHYNNFYEFSTDKDGVADSAARFRPISDRLRVDSDADCTDLRSPWQHRRAPRGPGAHRPVARRTDRLPRRRRDARSGANSGPRDARGARMRLHTRQPRRLPAGPRSDPSIHGDSGHRGGRRCLSRGSRLGGAGFRADVPGHLGP